MNKIMKKINFSLLEPHQGGRIKDPTSNIFFPWYTVPFLEKLVSWDLEKWKVFEYGAGDSTLWWRENSNEVISVDTNKDWANQTNSYFCDEKENFINFPKKFVNEGLFDCIIIDSEPVEWRDECIPTALECLKKGGVLIIDNFRQSTVNLQNWPIAEKMLSGLINEVFQNPNHVDWKTGYWIK